MLRLITVLSVIGCLTPGIHSQNEEKELSNDNRIINGERATIINFPYAASLQRYGEHFCGGSILNSLWILTAAHCLEKTRPDQADGITILMGSSDWRKGGVYTKVQEFHMHPQYDPQSMAFDIAVIRLVSPVIFSSSIKPIEMATEQPSDGTPCVVSGWGFTNSRKPKLEFHLRSTDVIFRTKEACSSPNFGYTVGLKDTMVCGEGDGTDACQGDSGGPLVDSVTEKQVGIVSWGYDCGLKGFPGIYTNVAQFKPWVMSYLHAW